MEVKEFFREVVRKKEQPWKVDEYSGIKGEKSHDHKTISGASTKDGKAVGGDVYYHRENNKILINLDENGNSLI